MIAGGVNDAIVKDIRFLDEEERRRAVTGFQDQLGQRNRATVTIKGIEGSFYFLFYGR